MLDWYLEFCWACLPEFGFPIPPPYLLLNRDSTAFAYGLDAFTCVKFVGVDCLLHVNHSVPLFLIAGQVVSYFLMPGPLVP